MSPFLAELLGTMLLILMGGGVVANVCLSKTKGNGAGWIAITTAWALGVFCTSPAIKDYPINFLGEMIGTFALMFVVFFITDGELTYESNSTLPIGLGSVGAIPVAFTVWVIGLSLGGTTGYAINPARDLAPRFIHFILPIKGKGSSHWEYAWVPVLGPIAGAAIAGMLYYVLK